MTAAQRQPQEQGGITKDSYISIGLVALLLAAAFALWAMVSGVRTDLLPKLASLETEIRSISKNIDRIETAVTKSTEDLRMRLKALEDRVNRLEK